MCLIRIVWLSLCIDILIYLGISVLFAFSWVRVLMGPNPELDGPHLAQNFQFRKNFSDFAKILQK